MMTTPRLCLALIVAASLHQSAVSARTSDNGDGTFTNPVLYADYPDPDIIRVGETFYMVSTSFVDSPGINVLRSPDLVNWELVGHVADTVDGGDAYDLVNGSAYRGGYWASSIRHRDGTFYVVVNPTFGNARIYHATDPAGPWQYHQLDRSAYDPGFFIDDDGTGYIVSGNGSLTLMRLNASYSAVVAQTNNFVTTGGEGSHLIKRDGTYYLFNAKPSVWPFQLLCSRATNLLGPWETGHVCLTAPTGGHQGAIVDLPDGSWWGFVHKDSGAVGRMPQISPVYWENNWPVFGTPAAPNQVPATATKPIAGKPLAQPATSDDFSATTLGLQWQWNHNPDPAKWSLTERPGHLRLRPTRATEFWTARNTLTQKGQGPRSHGIVRLDLAGMQAGDVAGFGTLGKVNGHIFVTAGAGGARTLGMRVDHRGVGAYTAISGVAFAGDTLHLRTDLNFETNLATCSYSTDGATWTRLGGPFPLGFDIVHSTFQGQKFALFCYNPNPGAGYVDVDSFTFADTAPLMESAARGRPRMNGTTFVADNGQLLRGPFASTEWGNPPPYANIAAIRELGQNAVHLYGEVFDPNYPATGSTAPGYAAGRIDQMVQMTREAGLYLVITIGNGAENGKFNRDYVLDFWRFYAPRYKDEPHVLFEIQNEPFAWSTPYSQATLDMERDAYTLIRGLAPQTPILLFSVSVLGDGASAVADIRSVSTAASVDWSNAAVAFHGYAGWKQTTRSVETILAAGFPVFMTEFTAADWGESGHDVQDIELTAELERLGVSWLSFLHIPPNFINSAVTDATAFRDIVDRAGVSWVPDYGMWPVARGVHGNGGVPRATTETWTSQMLTGTLRIEAEDFDVGGEGVAYHDTTSANTGGAARTDEGVDLIASTDTGGGTAVGATAAGEWLDYTVFVREPGYYDMRVRHAGAAASGLRVLCDGVDVTRAWDLASTGGASTWATATRQVFLGFGRQKMRVELVQGSPALNWIELSPTSSGPVANGTYKLVNRVSAKVLQGVTGSGTVVQQPFTSAAHQLWNFQHLGAGNYKITSAANTWSWSVFYTRDDDPLDFVAWWTIESKYQRYLAVPTDSGYFRLMPVQGGLSIGIEGASISGGAAARQFAYRGDSTQNWAVQAAAAPAIPTGLGVQVYSAMRNDLTWTAAPGATSYNVKRSNRVDGPFETIATGVATTAYSDTGAAAGTTYYYVVSANHVAGESLNSAAAWGAVLHARLAFDETAGVSAVDATGHGWTGSLVNGPTWTTGRFGGAIDLDGANDHLTLPTGVVDGLSSVTVAAWVQLDAASAWSRIFDFGSGTGSYMFLTPRNGASSVVRFAITAGSGEQVINGTSALPTGAWTHVAVTLGGGTGVLYVNGVEVGRNAGMTLTPTSLGASTQNYLGRSQWAADAYLDGRIDDFRIYASALSAVEIARLYAEVPGVAPGITQQPLAATQTAGGEVVLSVAASGSGALTYQWRLDGIDIPGATGATYTIPSVQAFHAGTYTVVVTAYGLSTTSSGAVVTVDPAPPSDARALNLSTRGLSLTGDDVLIPGFVIGGTGTKRILVRAVGPRLARMGVPAPLPDPQFVLKRYDGALDRYVDLASNDDWGTLADADVVAATAAAVYAFGLDAGSADAALVADLAPGRYTVVAGGKGSDTGIALVELYDADGGTPSARLLNISNRGYVGTGGDIMIPGFVVSAEGSRTFLVRAVGPGLARFGVNGVLDDPHLEIYRGQERILINDDWDGTPGAATTRTVAAQVSAFSLAAGSKDAAFVVSLPPGAYTVQARGADGGSGIALVEVYVVP
ncbi:MAG: family 43 glycosylhydrolase [Opitutaceae bacterium]|nr:family 43 glycosylhydrolase [Opitutaceae bacterium]